MKVLHLEKGKVLIWNNHKSNLSNLFVTATVDCITVGSNKLSTRKSSCGKPQEAYCLHRNLSKHNLFWGGGTPSSPVLDGRVPHLLMFQIGEEYPILSCARQIPHPVLFQIVGVPHFPGCRLSYPLLNRGYPFLSLPG